mmetsp:Transcript_18304/g.51774  ORF Transcript_18304/g.51774 Transcript_18304/m.51774 type:complete len:527 (+) Transcript_18304:69-1649(+)
MMPSAPSAASAQSAPGAARGKLERQEPPRQLGAERWRDRELEVRRKASGNSSKSSKTEEAEEREPSCLMMLLLCAVSMLEGMDTQLLPASMFALQQDIGFQLTDLAYLAVAQGVCINVAAPLWGILADRGVLRRKTILAVGSLGQGAATVGLAFHTSLWPMIAVRAVIGALLASLRPISNGIIADATSERRRGKIFGRAQCALLVGMFLSTMLVGNLSRKTILGIHGWRIAFGIVGVLAMLVSALVACLMQEPPQPLKRSGSSSSGQGRSRLDCGAVLLEEFKDLCSFLTIPTFCVMVVQGIFGTIPWTIMGNMMLYFQLSGIEDGKASVLTSEQPVAGAFGNLLGGYIADFLARRFGFHGRPLSAQITVALGIPLVWLIFGGVPPGSAGFAGYFALIAAFGLLGSWAQSGTNFPILSEIVPADSRSRVMAWECALENSIANLLGPPVVTLLATKAFGYTFGEHDDASGVDLHSARALGKAMQAVICIPWCVTLLAYTLLHWSYPKDVRRLMARSQQAQQNVKPEP